MSKEPLSPLSNREHIKRLYQGADYLTDRIAELSKIIEHITSICSGLALRVTALEQEKKHFHLGYGIGPPIQKELEK